MAVKKINNNILILGAEGLVGRTVFVYLSHLSPENVWGTTRNKNHINERMLLFSAESYLNDFNTILNKTQRVDYVINCIGNINYDSPLKELVYINSLLPHLLEELAEKHNFRLIQISTDAVFSPVSGRVNEKSKPSPVDNYGMSKLLGETTSLNSITIRTSFIGLDPNNHRGLLEKTLTHENPTSFTNQIWTGCTTLQFANLCEWIIMRDKFQLLRKKSPVFHFSPIGPISKYTLVKTFLKTAGYKLNLKKGKGEKRKRVLTTESFDLLQMKKYTSNINKSFERMIEFEKRIK